MANVKIDIPGVGEVFAENAASEATLKELVKVLTGTTGSGPTPPSGDNNSGPVKNVGLLGKVSKNTTKEVKGFGNALVNVTSGLLNTLSSAIGATVGAVTGLGVELLAGGNTLTDFAKYLPIPGLTTLSGLLDTQVDQFRQLSQTGASFSNNMFELTRIAGNAAIPQQDFVELLSQQSDSIRLFGNSVGDGAKRFASLSKEFRQSTAGKDLMAMGFTTQELNENLVSYNEMMVVSGRRRYMSDQDLVTGAQAYSKELDSISKLTGKSRKQLEEEIKQKNLDIRRQMVLAEQGEEFGLRLSQAAAVSPKLEEALLDMADGVANDPLTQQLMSNNQVFREQAQNIRNMSAEEMNNFMVGVRDSGMDFANSLGQAGVQASVAAGTSVGEYVSLTGELGKLRETTAGAIAEEQAARDPATAAMTTLAETINDLRGMFQTELLDSQIFQDLKNGFTTLIPDLESSREMYTKVSDYFKSNILPTLTDTWEWLKTDGLDMAKEVFNGLVEMWREYKPQITEWFDKLFTAEGRAELWAKFKEKAMLWVTEWWNGLSSADVLAGITAGLAAIVLGPIGLIGGTIVAGIVATFGWENIKSYFMDALEEYGPGAAQLASDAWDSIKSWFGSIWNGLFDFNIQMPDFSDYLPKWMGGKGLDWSMDSTSSNSAPRAQDAVAAAPEAESPTTPMDTSVTTTSSLAKNDSVTSPEYLLQQLNTTMQEVRDLQRTANRYIKNLDGNLMS